VPLPSHLTTHTPTISKLYLDISFMKLNKIRRYFEPRFSVRNGDYDIY
jgi:hypothetical protein